MKNKFLEVKLTLESMYFDFLIAELSEINYDSFQEEESTLSAYIEIENFDEAQLQEVIATYKDVFTTSYELIELENKNWNEEWEKNFDPVYINNDCVIRATFHKIEHNAPYEITINPRMSFGTGHHSTTALMIEHEIELDFKNKKIFDAGTGTGVLAIMAHLLGATEIHACDIDEWSFDNCQENFGLNDCSNVKIEQSTFDQYANHNAPYDIILANINKNVLLEEIKFYSRKLIKNGYLGLSGFYTEDIKDIEAEATKYGLRLKRTKDKNNWAALLFEQEE